MTQCNLRKGEGKDLNEEIIKEMKDNDYFLEKNILEMSIYLTSIA